MSHTNPQTGLVLEVQVPPSIQDTTFDTRHGEIPFMVQRIGTDMWATTEATLEVRAGSILIRDTSRDITGHFPFVTIVEGGLHSAIRQQADHVPTAIGRELEGLTLSVEMATEACMAARALHLMNFESIATWRIFVGTIAEELGERVRDELKIEAKSFLDFASDPYDSLDRLNGTSRMLVLNAAIRRLEKRIDFQHYLLGVTYNRRAFELFALYDRIWHVRTLVLREVSSMCVQYERPHTVNTDWADRAAPRLDVCVGLLQGYFVAPYGTNSFKHCARDLANAANALREERFGDAGELIAVTRRSLDLLGLQRELEAKRRAVSGYNCQKIRPSDQEQGAFARTLANRRDFLIKHPEVDLGFANRIATDLAGHLDRTVDAAVASRWDGPGVQEALSEACACFGRAA